MTNIIKMKTKQTNKQSDLYTEYLEDKLKDKQLTQRKQNGLHNKQFNYNCALMD